MKLGFTTSACPSWDLDTILQRAKEYGYRAVEIAALGERTHLPTAAEMVREASAVARRFADAGVELACLGSGARFDWPQRDQVLADQQQVRYYIRLAEKLGCPMVRVLAGRPAGSGAQRSAMLARVAAALGELAPDAASAGVTLAVENGDGAVSSRDLWYVLDAVSHPAVRCCWDEYQGAAAGERATLSIPRISPRLALVHLCDAEVGSDGLPTGHELPGQGGLDLARFIALLRGVAYDGCVMFDWPKRRIPSLADPEVVLPAARKALQLLIDAKGGVLTAYKGDDTAPKYVRLAPR